MNSKNKLILRPNTYKHSGTQVKLVKELGNKDVDFKLIVLVVLLSFTDDLSEPLILLLSTCHPDEEDLSQVTKYAKLKN